MLPKTIYGLATTSSPGLMSAEDKAKLDSNVVTASLVGANNGIAQLDSSGKVPASQLPSYVDDVLEYNSASAFPATGEADKIYIAKDTNISYRWGGSAYVKIASDLALGETSSSAYRGDRGKTAYDHATDASRLTTAATSGLYKVAVTNEGHVASVTAVQKSDITNLGIPGSHQDISGKADKVSGATNGNFAGLDSNGNLIDSGKKATDFLPTSAIDDTAGEGDTGKTWSADKLVETFEETEEAAALSKVIDTPTQVVSFSDGARWPMKMEFGIEPVQEGSGDPSPSNVRPISGWTGANVTVARKNLFKFGATAVDKTTVYRPNSTQRLIVSEELNGDLRFKYNGGTWSIAYIQIEGIDGTEDYAFSFEVVSNTTSYTPYIIKDETQSTEKRLVISIGGGNRTNSVGASNYFVLTKIQVEKGTTATEYEPFSGTAYPITFPSSAGTVYGGTVTVNPDGTGELVVDRVFYELDGSSDESYAISGNPYKYVSHGIAEYGSRYADSISNELLFKDVKLANAEVGFGLTNRSELRIRYGLYTSLTAEEARQWFAANPFQIVYYIATPITYSLTPGQVLSLLGQNNVWADCGQIKYLEYVRNIIGDVITERMDGIENDTCEKTINQRNAIQRFNGGSPYPIGLTAAIDPVQDLHGYDHPWPGGGGKNLIQMTLAGLKSEVGSGTWSGNTYTHNGVAYTVMLDSDGNVSGISANGTSSSFSFIRLGSVASLNGSYILNGGINPNQRVYIRNETSGTEVIRTTTTADVSVALTSSSDNIRAFIGIAESTTVSNVVFKPMLRLATETDPTFDPYSNICPISGFDGANVTVTGKNLAKSTGFVSGVLDWDKSTANTVIATSAYITSDFIPISDGYDKITVSAISGNFVRFYMLDSEKKKLYFRGNHPTQTEGSLTVVMVPGCKYIRFSIGVDGATYTPSDYGTSLKAQIEYGETATTYEPYAGTTYPITFPTSAGTVYGGTVTVNPDGTGELVVDRKSITLTSANKSYLMRNSSHSFWLHNNYVGGSNLPKASGSIVSDRFKSELTSTPTEAANKCFINSSGNIRWNTKESYADVDLMIEDLVSIQFVYEFATPVTYQLTPGQVLSLLGQNNVWADCGDILSLTYNSKRGMDLFRQDTAGQINTVVDPVKTELDSTEAAMAIVVDGDTAPKNITSGQYVFVKNHSALATGMYHATAAIASGASVTSSNVTADADGGLNAISDFLTVKQKKIGSLVFRQQGNVVTVNGYAGGLTIDASGVKVCDVPSEISTPTEIVRAVCNVGSNSYSAGSLGYLSISSSGEVFVATASGTATNVHFSVSYIVQ